jgi:rhodanese-related sulfurtransferase
MPESKVKAISSQQAYELLHKNPSATLIDVRSGMEFLFVGHPVGAIHIPWIDEPDWVVNPNFAKQVRKVMLGGLTCHVDGCAPVVMICRSGKRSREAGTELIKAGFLEVYNIEDGFEGVLDDNHHRSTIGGWRHSDLPWEQC